MPLVHFYYDFVICNSAKHIHCYASMVSISNNFRLLFQKFICFCNNCINFRFILTLNRIMQIRSTLIKWNLIGEYDGKERKKADFNLIKMNFFFIYDTFSSILEIFIAEFSIRFDWTSPKWLTVWRSLWKSSKKIATLNVSKMYNVQCSHHSETKSFLNN